MLIAGAGIIGLTCAWRLAQRGIPVTIFDAREAAAEASWAGAGMLSPGGEVSEDSSMARMAIGSLHDYPAFVKELEEAAGIQIDYQRCGAIERAFTEQEALALKQKADHQATLGILSEPINELDRFYPDDATVDPRDVTAALRIACLRAGVKLNEYEPVLKIDPATTSIQTTKSKYRDDAILIAAGAWSSAICPPGPPKSIPIRGHLIAFDNTDVHLDHILRHGHTYILQRRGTVDKPGRIIAGSTTEHAGFDRTVDETKANDVHERACQLLPALAALKPSETWIGFRPGLEGPAATPIIGQIEGTSVWTAFGHYRNGILLAPETARLISESIIAR